VKTRREFLNSALMTGCGVILFPGCKFMPMQPGGFSHNPFSREPTCVLKPDATQQDIIHHINQNILRTNAWQSNNVVIQSKGRGPVPIRLNAGLAVERPLNFRLRVRSLAGDEADFGSNQERFWFWMRRAEPRHVYTARHNQLGQVGQQMQIPFEPEWLMQALGVIPLDEQGYTMHHHPSDPGKVSMEITRRAPDGQMVRQSMVIDLCLGVIEQHNLFNAQGRLLAKAVLADFQMDPDSHVRLARRIHLEWPQHQMQMSLTIKKLVVNPTGMTRQTWQLPQIPDSPLVDLSQVSNAAHQQNDSGQQRFDDFRPQ